MLHRQQETEAKFRNHSRDQAEAILGSVIPKDEFKYLLGIKLRNWLWICWELLATFMLADAVLLLMQGATPAISK
jgi:hypothetical protein